MPKREPTYKIIRELSFISQFGFSIITPIILLTLLAVFLRDKFGLPDIIVVIGILLGVASGFTSAIKFYNYAVKRAEESEKDEML